MSSISSIIAALCLVSLGQLAAAGPYNEKNELQQTDQQNAEALEKTQALLRDREQRNAAMKDAPDAQANHNALEKVVGAGANTDAVYDLSADIFANIVKESKGDPLAMQQMMMDAQKNPQAFLNKLTPEQQARLKAISSQAEARQPTSKP